MAYLKELFISAMMRWINLPQPSAMGDVMAEQAEVLREQMASAIMLDEPLDDEDADEMPMPHFFRGRGTSFVWSSRIGRVKLP